MAKINILDSSVYNRIAAGEVVDRPYSVVKEFVENSIDAGATKISISIERGGKDLISVSDDGNGIGKEDLPAAFLPHATSKIASAEDLDRIMTLGFRGEALASIGSVARVTLRSRARGAGEAYEICCEGGTVSEGSPVCSRGRDGNNGGKFILQHSCAGEVYAHGQGGGRGNYKLCTAVCVGKSYRFLYLYGRTENFFCNHTEEIWRRLWLPCTVASVIAQCYQIDAVKHGIRIRGYIGKPDFTKATGLIRAPL